MEILDFLVLSERLVEYEFNNHVASDIPVDQLYLPPDKFEMQGHLDDISEWTKNNSILLNEKKSNYTILQ